MEIKNPVSSGKWKSTNFGITYEGKHMQVYVYIFACTYVYEYNEYTWADICECIYACL